MSYDLHQFASEYLYQEFVFSVVIYASYRVYRVLAFFSKDL